MLPAKTARTRSVGTKLTEEEYGRLESKASERGLTVGEWVREVLLEIRQSQRPAASPTEQALLADLIALRIVVLNLAYHLASGEPLTPERMQELIAKADGDQPEKARCVSSQVCRDYRSKQSRHPSGRLLGNALEDLQNSGVISSRRATAFATAAGNSAALFELVEECREFR